MARMLKDGDRDFKILVAGEGPLEKPLRQMAAGLKVEDKIVFLGFIDNVKAFMDNIDVFVLPSIWEGFGYVLVEAMACGKPVIAFNISSNPEIVVHDLTGYLVNPMDIPAFTHEVEQLIQDPGRCKSFGMAGRKRVEELFDLRITQKKIEGLLEGMVKTESSV
jgi:glycosyltransferase involved in cell wall biosynthesis